MRDGPVLGLVKRLIVASRRLDYAVTRRLSRQRPPFVLGGACCRSGRCCEAPALPASRLTFRIPLLRLAFVEWHLRMNGFELAEVREAERSFVFRCSHFDRRTRLCDSYATRPFFCRDYPASLLDQSNPVLLRGCGFRPIARNANGLRAALDAQDLTPSQRAALARDLHLD